MSISDEIQAQIEQSRPTADKKFKDWLNTLPEGDRLYIDGVLVNGDISVVKLLEILKSNGAPISSGGLYAYKQEITSKRVRG